MRSRRVMQAIIAYAGSLCPAFQRRLFSECLPRTSARKNAPKGIARREKGYVNQSAWRLLSRVTCETMPTIAEAGTIELECAEESPQVSISHSLFVNFIFRTTRWRASWFPMKNAATSPQRAARGMRITVAWSPERINGFMLAPPAITSHCPNSAKALQNMSL